MKKWLITVLGFLLGLLPLTYNACTPNPAKVVMSRGTEITNPMAPSSNKMALALCSVIQRCHPTVKTEECYAGVANTRGIGAPLGLADSSASLASISQAEQSGLLVGSTTSESTCTSAIDSLACDDPRVVAAFQSSSSEPFSGITNMVSGESCGKVFSSSADYLCSHKIYVRGVTNVSNGPVVPASGMTYAITPPLPSGLMIDSNTGVISGIPTAVVPLTTYTITASSNQKTMTSTVAIETVDGFLVNDLGDAADANVGDGICATASGVCTLRAALAEVNQSTNGVSDIVLPDGTILLSNLLTIKKTVRLTGSCSTPTVLDGQGMTALFDVTVGNLQISMSDLKLQNGNGAATGPGVINNGYNDGAIFNGNRLTFFNNRAGIGGNGGVGNWNGATSQFNCDDCVFDSNQSTEQAGTLVFNDQKNAFNRTLFTNNSGTTGAISDNSNQGSLFTNVTFFANKGKIGSGAVWVNYASANTHFVNTTFVNNQTVDGYAGAVDGGGNIHLTNSILLNNTGVNGDCDRATISHGGNLSTATASHCALDQPTDLVGLPVLGPLQNNGGYSNTLALLAGSPGIDQGLGDSCPAVDQRGLTRPARNACDIGAFEAQ